MSETLQGIRTTLTVFFFFLTAFSVVCIPFIALHNSPWVLFPLVPLATGFTWWFLLEKKD
jgi:hypothetical protein